MRRDAIASLILLAVGAVWLSGCTDLVTYHLSDDTSQIPPAAFPYALNKARLTTTFTVMLVNCAPAKASVYPSLNLKVSAVTTQMFEADPKERYYVDYTQLSTFWKSTTLKVTTGVDQTLQSVNTDSSDQTLQIAGAFLQAAASVAGAALTGNVHVPAEQAAKQQAQLDFVIEKNLQLFDQLKQGALATTHPPYQTISACSSDAIEAINRLNEKKAALKQLQAKVKSSAGASSPSTALDSAISQAANDVADAMKPLALTVPMTIEPKIEEFVSEADSTLTERHLYLADLLKYVRDKWVAPTLRSGWLDVSFNGAAPVTEALAGDQLAIAAAASKENGGSDVVPTSTDISFELFVRKFSFGRVPALIPKQSPGTTAASGGAVKHDGLVVRQPALGFFRACLGLCQPPDEFGVVSPDSNGKNLDLQPQVQVSIPQLGKKLEMPLHNGFGQDMSLALTLSADGSMNILSFQDNSTIGAGLTAIGGAGTAATNALAARNGAITARNGAITGQEGLAVSAEQIAVGYAGLANTNASFADNALKAQADCIQQVQTIVKNGRSPTVQCPGGQ